MKRYAKKTWETPELVTYGRVEDLTKQIVKRYGYNDGISLDTNGDGQGDTTIGGAPLS